jgi:hypothetical protein
MPNKLQDIKAELGQIITVWNTERKAFCNSKRHYRAILVKDESGKEKFLFFTDNAIKRAEYTASRNPEDLPSIKKSWWTTLFKKKK